MEAMAMGVPVICSPWFRTCFGDAALYASPREVGARVTELWRDVRRYQELTEAGRAYLGAYCDRERVASRVAQLLDENPPQGSAATESAVNRAI